MKKDHKNTRHSLCSYADSPAFSGRMRDPVPAFPLPGNTGPGRATDIPDSGTGTSVRGSLSLEASVCVPLFLLFCIAVISFLQILCLQTDIRARMAETARSMGKKAYIIERLSENDGIISGGPAPDFDADTVSLASAGINPLTIKVWMLSDGRLRSTLEQSRILGGASGLYTYASSYDSEKGVLDIVACYDYSVPWMTAPFGTLRFVQRMRSCAWIGESLEKENGGLDGSEQRTVYVTPTGTVYHLSVGCSYLDLSIHSASYAELARLRNAGGARYERCEECAAKGVYVQVFITDYGTKWHSSLNCSGLKRTVIEKDISEISGMKLCTKCKNGEHGTHSH